MNRVLKIIITYFLLVGVAQGSLFLKVVVLNQKGIDKNLTLTSELHSLEEMRPYRDSILKMKNGNTFRLTANFNEVFEEYGPSTSIDIALILKNKQGEEIKKLDTNIKIDESKTFVHSDKFQRLQIEITPFLK